VDPKSIDLKPKTSTPRRRAEGEFEGLRVRESPRYLVLSIAQAGRHDRLQPSLFILESCRRRIADDKGTYQYKSLQRIAMNILTGTKGKF
jgi:hypothetical protein